MTVVVLVAVPPGLRGHLTRWLLEIAPGVFVGTITARVRNHLWSRVVKYLGDGAARAVMVYPARNEQGLTFQVTGGSWEPVDYDGLMLIRRSLTSESSS